MGTKTLEKSLMTSYFEKMPDATITEIAKAIKKDENIDLYIPTIKRLLTEYKSSVPVDQELFIKDYGTYKADSANYYFVKDKDTVIIPTEMVGKIVCAYTTEGLNRTKVQVSKILNITTAAVSLVLSKLKVTKDSDIKLEAILDQYDEKFHADFVKACMNAVLEESPNYEDPIKDAVFDTYKKSIFNCKHKERDLGVFVKTLGDHIYELATITPALPTITKEVTVVLADIHFGAGGDNYNKDAIIEKFKEISGNLRNYTDCKVNVILLGDIFHSISGTKHADIWKDMEPGIHGANAFIEATEVFTGFLSSIVNLNSVHIVGGNHDSLASNIREEPSAEGAKLFSYMLSKALEPYKISVHFDYHLLTFKHANMTIIGMHGDQATGKMQATELAWKFGDNSSYNVILSGHLHSRIINRRDDNTNCRKLFVPSFSPADAYAKRNGWSNLSGYVLITGKELPTIIDVPLKY